MKKKVETSNYADAISAAVVLFKGGLLEEINSSEYYTGLHLFKICRSPDSLDIYVCDSVESEILMHSIPIECISEKFSLLVREEEKEDEDAVPLPYSNPL